MIDNIMHYFFWRYTLPPLRRRSLEDRQLGHKAMARARALPHIDIDWSGRWVNFDIHRLCHVSPIPEQMRDTAKVSAEEPVTATADFYIHIG